MALIAALAIWIVALALLLPAIFGPWQPPEAITPLAREIDRHLHVTFLLTATIFVVSQAALGYAVWRFGRKRSGPAQYFEANNRWEMLWTSAGAALFIGLSLMSYSAWAEARIDTERHAPGGADRLVVEVVGQQFVWNMRYPGPDGKFGPTDPKLIDDSIGNSLGVDRDNPDGADDIVVPRLALPVNREVELVLTSKDVLHSFFVPELRLKLDTVPGLVGRLRFTPDKVGEYEIACAELCGLGHYRMRAYMDVMEPARFENWLQEQAAYFQ